MGRARDRRAAGARVAGPRGTAGGRAALAGAVLPWAVLLGLAACGGTGGTADGGRDALDAAPEAAEDPGADPARDDAGVGDDVGAGDPAPEDGGPGDDGGGPDGGPDAAPDGGPGGGPDADACTAWDPGPSPGPVRGWILLDPDPEAVAAALEAAPRFGVNHVELSHDLIMDIDEIVGEGAAVQARVDLLNEAIAAAHAAGAKAYVWSHELPSGYIAVCYGPEGEVWRQRAEAYRAGLARIPDVDGVVLMFGSAGTPPWLTFCDCDWCLDTWGESLEAPPQPERIRLITEHVAAVVQGELGKEIVARVFVHEPEENAWHREGLAALPCSPFVTLHKDAVNDWQPYNPPDPTMPVAPGRPAVMETDAAGEYFGQSELPFAAPGYYRYRLAWARDHGAVGYAARIERGSRRALQTPNEVNLWALKMLAEDPRTPLADVWDAAFQSLYGTAPGSEASATLRAMLETTFPVRLKSHYALGIWALEKGSDIPSKPAFDQFYVRGDMRKWDPDWTATWEALDRPGRGTILRLYQEGTEALTLAEEALALCEQERMDLRAAGMTYAALDDLDRRLRHQRHAAAAWRAVDLFLWSSRARNQGLADPDLAPWMAFALQELESEADAMDSWGLTDVGLASPARLRAFAAAARAGVPEGTVAAAPPAPTFGPLRVVSTGPDRATLRFRTRRTVEVTLEVGLEMPDFGRSVSLGTVELGQDREVELDGLEPGRRYVARLRAPLPGGEAVGGESWIFTSFP